MLDNNQLPLSVCVIAAKTDAHYVIDLLKTIPQGCEVIVLWNEIADHEAPATHRKTVQLSTITVKYYETTRTSLHFADLRNECISLATRNWILWLDADDRLLIHQHDFFKTLEDYPPGIGGLVCGCVGSQPSFASEFDDSMRYHVPTIRLFRNGYGFRFEGAAHEQIGWAISSRAFRTAPCSLLVHHVGYEVSADKIKAKLERNAALLSKEYAACTDPEKRKLWGAMLARDSNHLMKYQG